MASGDSKINTDSFIRTYTSFSGADIVCTFAGVVIGELQAITYHVQREKAPVYTMGSAEPRSFSRGKFSLLHLAISDEKTCELLESLKFIKAMVISSEASY